MIDQDMLFRTGLMLAVVVLAGSFGAALALERESGSATDLDGIGEILKEILLSVHGSEPGSSVAFHLGHGDVSGSDGIGMEPGAIPGDLSIRVLPGMVVLRSGGDESIISAFSGIVPSFPPPLEESFNSSIRSEIAREMGGYVITPPCVLMMEKIEGSPRGTIFVYPLSKTSGPVEEAVSGLDGLFRDGGMTVPGWDRKVSIPAVSVHSLDEGYMVLTMENAPIEEGICALPVLIPGTFGVDPEDCREMEGFEEVIFTKEAFIEADGNISIRCMVECE